jgi:rhamnose utilization protein RhaD (predicted bifunctional aldolase and dehydrogenase)/NAD(P)-dependent dehydrogenase (short-subunit alcohol dehydrogenase family)
MFHSRWVDGDAKAFIERHAQKGINAEIALRVYTSNLIGSDPDLVMHGGGNTSCKTTMPDLFGNDTRVICVKGSGWDLGTIEAPGLPAVRLEPLLELRNLDALSDENMVNVQRANLMDQASPNPSVETLLHAFLPHNVVDHTHATPFLALANLPEPEAIMREIFGTSMAIIPYVMPGFALAKLAAEIAEQHPEAEGLLLLQHGHFTWGEDAKQSYDRVIDQTNSVEAWFADRRDTIQYPGTGLPKTEAQQLIHDLKRALNDVSSNPLASFVLDWIDDAAIRAQIDQHISNRVLGRGVATPDHVIRIKAKPLVLSRDIQTGGVNAIANAIKTYINDYTEYFNTWSSQADSSKTMLDPMPKLVWVEGMGLIGIGGSFKEAKTITDLGVQNVRVTTDAESAGGFYPVADKDLFDMEYWSLEQAKLGKASQPQLQGKVTVITGAGGAIGSAMVKVFEKAGAEVVAVDISSEALAQQGFSAKVLQKTIDLTDRNQIEALTNDIVRKYGGIDILVSNAGTAPLASILEMEEDLLRLSFEINFFAHFHLAQSIGKVFVAQGNPGQMLFNISKQAVNPGRNFGAYGLPKATLMFLVKQLALELGEHGIRVNGVNADRIRSGILNENMVANRAKARGVTVEQYIKGNLLNEEVEARHVAEAFLSLALSTRTTAHIMTVDGGNIEASLR